MEVNIGNKWKGVKKGMAKEDRASQEDKENGEGAIKLRIRHRQYREGRELGDSEVIHGWNLECNKGNEEIIRKWRIGS